MEDDTYRKTQKMRALARWENEGGRITDDVPSRDRSTGIHVRDKEYEDRREIPQLHVRDRTDSF
jgi:hypothetical protein